MPKKLTLKQTAFRDLYIETGNATEAYRRAYDCKSMKDATIRRSAHELLKNPNIAATLAEIQAAATEKVIEKHAITLDFITEGLLEDRRAALKLDASAASVSARKDVLMALAKLHGLVVDTVNNVNQNYVMGVERELTDAEFEQKHIVGVEASSGAANHTA